MFDTIRQKCQEYYDQIPPDTLSKMAKSALFSFSISLILLNKRSPGAPWNLSKPLLNAGVAALASFVYALTAPLFNALFGDKHLRFHREIMKNLVVVTLTSTFVNYLTTSKVNFAAFNFVAFLPSNVVISGLDLLPTAADFISAHGLAQACRDGYQYLGLDALSGSSSTYIAF